MWVFPHCSEHVFVCNGCTRFSLVCFSFSSRSRFPYGVPGGLTPQAFPPDSVVQVRMTLERSSRLGRSKVLCGERVDA
jgi:hypothetical protein